MSISNNKAITLGLIQATCALDPAKNLQDAIQAVTEASEKGAQIVCLQELFRSRYFCQTENAELFSLAETIPGPSTEALCKLAAKLEIVIIVPLFEKRTEGIYHNTAVVIDADGSIVGKYRKMHIPDDPCFYEKFYFTPGDSGFRSFATRYGRVGVLICWDQWFPEAARLTALSGAQFLFYPTAIGFQQADASQVNQQIAAWETVQKGHAIANGVFLAAANRVGTEDALKFWGRSFVSNPFGEVLAQAGSDSPEILIATCDLSKIETTRQSWPFLRDRRIDAYQGITQIYNDPND
ncbi:MAG: carbon-nitrogen hydrolase [Nitrospinae bacterium]|jgi:N-carbamoylputrescine amidase|nr:carbon-nitrogen hydrolase [Nitrospinota bacterium]MDA1108470.1 carbon-nitrogen hydrolase [Nitrospinota bacterium]